MIRAHVDAVGAFLRARGLTVYGTTDADGVPQQAVGPYAFITPSLPVESAESMCDEQDTAAIDVTVTSVGESLMQCLWVAERVHGLAGASLDVPGRLTYVRSVTGGTAQPDRDVPDRLVWFAPAGFTIDSLAA